jgi:DNA-binding MarR family transcriptional regulator
MKTKVSKKTNLKKRVGSKKQQTTPQLTAACDPIVFHDVTKIHPILKSSLGYCLSKLTTLIKAQLERKLKQIDLNIHQMALLAVLSIDNSTNQNQMCDELGVDKASMVKLIDQIEQLKLVERVNSSEDRRVKFLHITEKGRSTLAKARALRLSVEEQFLSTLSEAEKLSLRSIVPKLLENLLSTEELKK